MDIFISHSDKNEKITKRICEMLETNGHNRQGRYKTGSVRSGNRERQKKALELIEFAAVTAICIAMFLHEREVQVQLGVGDRVTFGTYLGEPIVWRVIRLEGKNEVVLLSEDILTFKAFSAAESGSYNYDDDKNCYWSIHETEADRDLELQAYVRGNSSWEDSDIRTWLNSDKEYVVYDGTGPVASAMSEKKNGYIGEAGFLAGFTKKERDAIVPTHHATNANALDRESAETTDLVYLLSEDELAWLAESNVSIYAKPTAAALGQDQTSWYTTFSLQYGVDTYFWWLREPVPDKASRCYMVENGYTSGRLTTMEAGVEGFGIRPAIKINKKKFRFDNT